MGSELALGDEGRLQGGETAGVKVLQLDGWWCFLGMAKRLVGSHLLSPLKTVSFSRAGALVIFMIVSLALTTVLGC